MYEAYQLDHGYHKVNTANCLWRHSPAAASRVNCDVTVEIVWIRDVFCRLGPCLFLATGQQHEDQALADVTNRHPEKHQTPLVAVSLQCKQTIVISINESIAWKLIASPSYNYTIIYIRCCLWCSESAVATRSLQRCWIGLWFPSAYLNKWYKSCMHVKYSWHDARSIISF